MVVFLLILFLVFTPQVHASRITIETETTIGTVGEGGVSIKAKLLQADSPDSGNSHRENATIKIRDAREGDRCDTIGGGSDVNGYIYGTCYATQTGSYSAYVHSNDRGDDSPDVSLTFNEPPAKSDPTSTPSVTEEPVSGTPEVTKKVAAPQLQRQGAASQTNPLIQDGLAPLPPDVVTGLTNDSQQVLGDIDSSSLDKGAPDLLKSLIFITGALVLLIWSGYLIYLQIRQSRNKKSS